MTLHDRVTQEIREQARKHHGAVRTRDLRLHGMDTVQRRVTSGLLVPRAHGIFVVPDLADDWTDIVIALAASSKLALTDRAAAALYRWDTFDRPPKDPALVTPWTSSPLLRPYRHRHLTRADIQVVDGIRVTTPLWTLRHLHTEPSTLECAVESALRHAQVDEDDLWINPPPALAAVLEQRGRGTPPTESLLETRAVQLVLRPAELPVRARQVEVFAGRRFLGRPDFLLPGWTVLETDGAQHATPAHKQADDRRDMALAARGLQVHRAGWPDVTDTPRRLAARLWQVITLSQEVHKGEEPKLDGRVLRV